jgi:hypothetical protein
LKGIRYMSRNPARDTLIAAGAVSVVVSMCVLGAVAAGTPAAATGASATTSSVLQPTREQSANSQLMSGSHSGVWFKLGDAAVSSTKSLAAQAALAENALAPAAKAGLSGSIGSAGATNAAPTPAPSLHQQSRSSSLAAVSGEPRDIAKALAATRGWTGSQWTCLDKLWNHESKYETTVRNIRSGAYGIPQALPASKMASAGSDWRTNPVTQIVWGLNYIDDRYETPCGAWSYWMRHSAY